MLNTVYLPYPPRHLVMRAAFAVRMLAVALLAAVVSLMGATHAGAQDTDQDSGTASGAQVRVLSSSFDADTTLTSLIGGERSGIMRVTLQNISDAPLTDIETVLALAGQTMRIDDLDVDVDETITVDVPVTIAQGDWGPQDISLTFNGTDVTVTHWNLPWILIVAVALVINALLLTIRNGLRNRVRKQLIAERRREDLGNVQLPEKSLAPAITRALAKNQPDERGSAMLPIRPLPDRNPSATVRSRLESRRSPA